jgi:hypothetical protein
LHSWFVLLYVECMAFFISEKETEDYLSEETRMIPMPDGEQRAFTGFKLMWRSLDYLVLTTDYSSKDLVEQAAVNAEETGCSFEDSFPNVLAYIHREARKAQGID